MTTEELEEIRDKVQTNACPGCTCPEVRRLLELVGKLPTMEEWSLINELVDHWRRQSEKLQEQVLECDGIVDVLEVKEHRIEQLEEEATDRDTWIERLDEQARKLEVIIARSIPILDPDIFDAQN